MLKIIIFCLVPFLKKVKFALLQKYSQVEMEKISLDGSFKHNSNPFRPLPNPPIPLLSLKRVFRDNNRFEGSLPAIKQNQGFPGGQGQESV